MFTSQDLHQMAQKGLSPEVVSKQLEQIKNAFPYLKLEAAASIGMGILKPTQEERERYIRLWQRYKNEGHEIVKFVPASGAASRMFKDLFAFVDGAYDVPQSGFETYFFEHIRRFAFYEQLNEVCQKLYQKCIDGLVEEQRYKDVVKALLNEEGLNYGSLPKGLLLFHSYDEGQRTSMEEHLVEGALYAASHQKVQIHFTVSHEHLPLFKKQVEENTDFYAKKFGVDFHISFSEQKPSTDTIAAGADNSPFRNEDGSLLFRPGGHGALIENLNDIEGDIVFIKNIDNVVPDQLKDATVEYKELLAGILVERQTQIFDYLRLLDEGTYTASQLAEITDFVQQQLCCRKADVSNLSEADLAAYLHKKLNRPVRVCGMVKNEGEPGGGPFWVYNQDGTISLQILESSQIDTNNIEYVRMFKEGTHFNPVDLVAGIRNYQGKPFHLPAYVDGQTGFISSKSKNGKELKALELPGLWNGAMSDWNTIFVEVPVATFNPVKTVNDLLRDEHQSGI